MLHQWRAYGSPLTRASRHEQTESARVAGARINGCLSLQRTRKITLDSGAKRYPIAQDPAPEAIEVFEDRFVQEDTNAFRLDSLTLRTVQPT